MVDRLRVSHRRASAALFNASNHEYFTIPVMVNVFDPALAVRVTSFQDAVWEQGMTLCMWLRFLTLDDAWQTLFEMSNGYATEHVYVRRYADTSELLFGVMHSGMKKEMVTAPSSMGPTLVANTWTHVCWVVQHTLSLYSNATTTANSSSSSYYIVPQSLLQWASYSTSYASSTSSVGVQAMASYNASWTVYVNGNQSIYYSSDGLMPIVGSYSTNFLGYGTSYTRSYFHGSMSDLRMYERPLDARSVFAIYAGDQCCTLVSSGTYVDTASMCTGKSLYNSEFCRTCKSDCGPLYFIDNEDLACNGRRTADFTLCKPCSQCSTDQYIGQTCTGTSFSDESVCYSCKHKTPQDCPTGRYLVGQCQVRFLQMQVVVHV